MRELNELAKVETTVGAVKVRARIGRWTDGVHYAMVTSAWAEPLAIADAERIADRLLADHGMARNGGTVTDSKWAHIWPVKEVAANEAAA